MDGDALIDDLIGRGAASRAKLENVRGFGLAGDELVDALAEAGCPPREIIAAMCAVSGLPEAPRSALAGPRVPKSITLGPDIWSELPAVPFGEDASGVVLIAAASPDVEDQLHAFDVPEFRLHLAPAALIHVALKRAYPEAAGVGDATAIQEPSKQAPPVRAVMLDDSARPRGNSLPTVAMPALGPEPDTAMASHDVDDGSLDEPILDDPILDDLDAPAGAPFDEESAAEDDDFDGPTQAVDPSAFLPQLASGMKEALADFAPSGGGSASSASLDPDGFDDDDDDEFAPKTVAMSATEMRESLVAVGAMAPAVADDEELATVTISADEMRKNVAALRANKTGSRVAFSDAAPTQLPEQEDVQPSVEIEADLGFSDESGLNAALAGPTGDGLNSGFDYSAAADEFDDGVSSGGSVTAPTERARDRAGSGAAAGARTAASSAFTDDDDDPFEEATIQAPPVEASPPAARRPPPSFERSPATRSTDDEPSISLSDDIELIDDDDDISALDDASDLMDELAGIEGLEDVEVLGASEPSSGRKRAPSEAPEVRAGSDSGKGARKLQTLDDDDDDLLFIDESDADGDDDDDSEVDVAAVTHVPESPRTQDLRGQRTTPVPALKPKLDEPDKKGLDTAPTGPIAISGYEVRDVLGAGGMATVYRALQKSADRDVALKILSPHLANDTAFVARFQREIRSSIALTHANIVRTYDYGDEAGVYYMATEIMDGGSLREVIRETGRLPIALTVRFIEHLLRGIGHAHRKGMVHRDIKPANLMLCSEGLLKIGDFGIAKSETDENLTKTGALFGTPAYMSPEQALGKQVDSRSDLFACGIILYELLAGDNPYQAENASAALLKVSRADPPPLLFVNPAIPRVLLDVVDRLQTRDADDRYQTAEEALEDLEPLIEAVELGHGDVIQRYLEDRTSSLRTLDNEHAEIELKRARRLNAAEPARPHAAATAAYIATKLDPDNESARRELQKLREDHDLNFGQTIDARVHDAERALQDDPKAPGLLRRAADLHRASGNPFKAGAWLREYLKVKPTDSHARNQLVHLNGDDDLGGYSASGERAWEPPSDLDWNATSRADDSDDDRTELPPDNPSDTQAPAVSDTTAMPDLSGMADSSPDAADIGLAVDPVHEQVSSSNQTFHRYSDEPNEEQPRAAPSPQGANSPQADILRKATQQARAGGLHVIAKDEGPAGPPGSHSGPNIMQQGRNERPPPDPAALALPDWNATPGGPPSASAQRSMLPPPAKGLRGSQLKGLVAAAIGALVVLLLVAVGVWRASSNGDIADVALADPGGPVEARQAAMRSFAESMLEEGDAPSAVAAIDYLIDIDPQSSRALSAIILRADARVKMGDVDGARADLNEIISRFEPDNFLHIEAKKKLDALP